MLQGIHWLKGSTHLGYYLSVGSWFDCMVLSVAIYINPLQVTQPDNPLISRLVIQMKLIEPSICTPTESFSRSNISWGKPPISNQRPISTLHVELLISRLIIPMKLITIYLQPYIIIFKKQHGLGFLIRGQLVICMWKC